MKAIIMAVKENEIEDCKNHILDAGGEVVAICRGPNDLQELVNGTFDTVVSYYPLTFQTGPNVIEAGLSFKNITRISLHEQRNLRKPPRDISPETWDKALAKMLNPEKQ